jgi:hypothetical protein
MDTIERSRNLSLRELSREALWFSLHTLIAVAILALVLAALTQTHPDPAALEPKLLGTALAFLFPLEGGFFIARKQRHVAARTTWISGLVTFALVSVWVLDLPTGIGLCNHCSAAEKLIRTFFDIAHGSGLMNGNGLLIGTWIPLAMVGYAAGAKIGLSESIRYQSPETAVSRS